MSRCEYMNIKITIYAGKGTIYAGKIPTDMIEVTL